MREGGGEKEGERTATTMSLVWSSNVVEKAVVCSLFGCRSVCFRVCVCAFLIDWRGRHCRLCASVCRQKTKGQRFDQPH